MQEAQIGANRVALSARTRNIISPYYLTMGVNRLIFLGALFFGLVGLVHGQRPEFPPAEGCKVGYLFGCPGNMDCYRDSSWELGGFCACNAFYGMTRQPILDDGNEFDVFATGDCRGPNFVINVLALMPMLLCSLSFTRTAYTMFISVYRIRKEGVKWSVTTVAMIFLGIGTTGAALSNWQYFFMFFNFIDDGNFMHDYLRGPFNSIWTFGCYVAYWLILIAWFDLVQKTAKMSKRSSNMVQFLKKLCIAFALAVSLGYIYFVSFVKGLAYTGFSLGGNFLRLFLYASVGYSLERVLCKDMNDTSNPNWKAAKAIRRYWRHHVMLYPWILFSVVLSILARRRGDIAIASGWSSLNSGHMCYIFTAWTSAQYLLFGNRKHLQKYGTEEASQYYGFSTMGINRTLSSVRSSSVGTSSFESRKSALTSSATSVAAASSVEEGGGGEKQEAA